MKYKEYAKVSRKFKILAVKTSSTKIIILLRFKLGIRLTTNKITLLLKI